MRYLILLITILVVVAVFIIPFASSLLIRYIPENSQPSLDQTVKVYGKQTVSQSIKVGHNGFSQIGLSIKNPNLANKKDITLTVTENGTVIHHATLNGAHIPDGKFMKFTFDPIFGSNNKTFQITIAAHDANINDTLEIFVTKEIESEVLVGDDKIPGSLSLVSYYKSPTFLYPFSQIIHNVLVRFGLDLPFTVSYLVVVLGCLLYLVLQSSAASFLKDKCKPILFKSILGRINFGK